jgi:hypothetical protein
MTLKITDQKVALTIAIFSLDLFLVGWAIHLFYSPSQGDIVYIIEFIFVTFGLALCVMFTLIGLTTSNPMLDTKVDVK